MIGKYNIIANVPKFERSFPNYSIKLENIMLNSTNTNFRKEIYLFKRDLIVLSLFRSNHPTE